MQSLYAITGIQPRGAVQFVKDLPDREPLLLIREPDNRHDRNAIKVVACGETHIGYIKAVDARTLGPRMDAAKVQEIAGALIRMAGVPHVSFDDKILKAPKGAKHDDVG